MNSLDANLLFKAQSEIWFIKTGDINNFPKIEFIYRIRNKIFEIVNSNFESVNKTNK